MIQSKSIRNPIYRDASSRGSAVARLLTGVLKNEGRNEQGKGRKRRRKNFASNIYILYVHVYIHAYIVRCYLHGTVFTTIVAIGVGPRDASYAETKLACLFTYGWLHAFAHTVTRAIFKFLPRTHWEYNICGWNGTTRERKRWRREKYRGNKIATRCFALRQIFRGFGYIYFEPFKIQRPENALRTFEPCQREYSASLNEKLYQTFSKPIYFWWIHSGGGKWVLKKVFSRIR